MSTPKIVVHTDVFVDHLLAPPERPSVLRLALQLFFCYTTVFNAIELFALARSPGEEREIRRSMSSVKMLGLNARGAAAYGKRLRQEPALRAMNSLVAGLCRESALPLLTGAAGEFTGARRLVVVPSAAVVPGATAQAILRRARQL